MDNSQMNFPAVMTFNTCTHNIPKDFKSSMDNSYGIDKEFGVCPPCKISRITERIRTCRSWFRKRGGIMQSYQTSATDTDKDFARSHLAHTKEWRKLKIAMFRWITIYESILERPATDKPELDGRSRALMEQAIAIWESDKEGLMNLPGVRLVADEHQDIEEGSGSPDVQREVSTGGQSGEEDLRLYLPEDHQRLRANECLEQSSEEPARTDEEVNIPHPNTDDGGLVEFLALSGGENLAVPEATKEEAAPDLATIAPPSRLASHSSILRRATSQPSKPRPTKSLTFHDLAEIIPDPDSSPAERELRPHSEVSSAPTKRPRDTFHRTNAMYTPQAWASPRYYDKVETSWCSVEWEDWEEAQKSAEEGGGEEGGGWNVREWYAEGEDADESIVDDEGFVVAGLGGARRDGGKSCFGEVRVGEVQWARDAVEAASQPSPLRTAIG
ncbi:hypothetical protein CC80DRAFT_550187 [Byssothecium circinans]|uniref:Uncharacterized protein n=1 Tax=Byssothecium circinans TaxID=147558 RepID=A0A6A5TRI8_9PLEO|nr:hypothetical protein CC80DRAFT_550187 [Byssothecium circinans]